MTGVRLKSVLPILRPGYFPLFIGWFSKILQTFITFTLHDGAKLTQFQQMKPKGPLGHLHPFSRLILLALLMVGSLLVISFIGVLVVIPIWGRDMLGILTGENGTTLMTELKYARFFQILTHLGLFIVPSFVFAWMVGRKPLKYLDADSRPYLRNVFLGVLIMVAALPLVNLLMEINLRLTLPESLSSLEEWMRRSEEGAEELTKNFLNVDTWQGLLFNIFMIAVIPAIGEEFIFRGALLKTLREWSRSGHLAVWVSSILFSALHFQFFGFLPRLLLGLLLGYMMLWSGNIWIPVVAHFFNNAAAVVFYYLFYNGYTSFDLENLGERMGMHEGLYLLSVVSLLLLVVLFWMFRDIEKRLRRRSTLY
jgi:uncharacterized protein